MQGGGLANLAVILVFTIIFFVVLTQRMMLSTDGDIVNGGTKIWSEIKSYTGNRNDSDPLRVPGVIIKSPVIELQATSIAIKEKEDATHKHSSNIKFKDQHFVAKKTKDEIIDLNDYESPIQNHPFESPRKGTDISLMQQTSLLLCLNQSKCIVPELQLQKKYKIYLCKHPTRQGVRFYYLAREGLLLHPNVELLSQENMLQADYFVYLPGSAPWHLTECNNTALAPRMIVLDEFDGHTLVAPTLDSANFVKAYGKVDAVWYYMYFKRSFVRRNDGQFIGYPHLVKPDTYPMTYAIAEAYIPHRFNSEREIEISCTLRGSKQMTTRQRVQDWVAEYGKVRGVERIITAQVDNGERKSVSKLYFHQMFNTRIIVTVNPANWEGDFRLWEAMGSGSLIFVDPIFVPHQFPLIDGVHVVYFSNNNKTDLWSKLDYYRQRPDKARQVAVSGYLHAMKYHRTVSLIDYVLRSVHLKEAKSKGMSVPHYSYTGQYLNAEARRQEEQIRSCHSPGLYEDPAHPGHSSAPRYLKCDHQQKSKAATSNIAFSS